jgi:hypothetical protein
MRGGIDVSIVQKVAHLTEFVAEFPGSTSAVGIEPVNRDSARLAPAKRIEDGWRAWRIS